jgi:hypothetical protein
MSETTSGPLPKTLTLTLTGHSFNGFMTSLASSRVGMGVPHLEQVKAFLQWQHVQKQQGLPTWL